MEGKERCKILKKIRKEFADANGIPYEPEECNQQGECYGVCPACEEEAAELMALAKKKEEQGYEIIPLDRDTEMEMERLQNISYEIKRLNEPLMGLMIPKDDEEDRERWQKIAERERSELRKKLLNKD